MKRTLSSCLLLLWAALAFAADQVTLVAGNVEPLREAEAKIEFVVDYSETTVEGKSWKEYLKSRGDDFVKDWPSDSKKAREYFVVRYNKKNKKFAQVLEMDGTGAKYKMVLHIKTMDTGNGGSSFVPFASTKAGGVIINGCVDVAEKATGKPVCKFNITEAKGTGHVSETVRIGLCYSEIAAGMAKIIKKSTDDLPISAKDIRVNEPVKAAPKAKSEPKKTAAVKKPAAAKKTTTARKTTQRKTTTAKKPAAKTTKR